MLGYLCVRCRGLTTSPATSGKLRHPDRAQYLAVKYRERYQAQRLSAPDAASRVQTAAKLPTQAGYGLRPASLTTVLRPVKTGSQFTAQAVAKQRGKNMSNQVSFTNTEVSSLRIATAKNGNTFVSGFIVDTNQDGSYTTSKAFRSFDAAVIDALPAELVASVKVASENGKAVFPKGSRPRISVEGWLQNKADAKGVWSETLIVTSLK